MTAVITWGDGRPTSAGTVSYDAGSGLYTVSGTHTYAEEGTYPISIAVSDDGGARATISGTATVADAALTGSSAAVAGGTEGATNSSVLSAATFTDANPGNHTNDFIATIAWGDGGPTSAGTVSYDSGSGTYTVTGSHTYAEEGSYAISISVADQGGSMTTISGTATVADAALTDTTPTKTYSVTADRSTGSQVLATFTDGNPLASASDYTPTVNWGGAVIGTASVSVESVPQTPPASTWQVVGSAIYAAQGSYPISVAVHDAGGNTFTSSGKVEFDAGAALLTDTTPQKTYSAIEGSSTKTQVLATFSDANATAQPTSFMATVAWAGTLVGTPTVSVKLVSKTKTLSKWEVTGSAIYADVGTYSATVFVQDTAGNVLLSSGKTQFKVAGAALHDVTKAKTYKTVEGTSTGTEVLATFTDADPYASASEFTPTVNWVEGVKGTPTVSVVPVSSTKTLSTWDVEGSAVYAQAGTFAVKVTVADADGKSVSTSKVKFKVSASSADSVSATAAVISVVASPARPIGHLAPAVNDAALAAIVGELPASTQSSPAEYASEETAKGLAKLLTSLP